MGHTQQVLAAVVLPQRGGGLQGRVLIHGKRSRALAHNSFSLAGVFCLCSSVSQTLAWLLDGMGC